jgi:cytochrome c oxidase subunit I
MATAEAETRIAAPRREPLGRQLARILTTTDHKTIGKLYLVTSFTWFLIGGTFALLIRPPLPRDDTGSSS